MGKIYFDVMKEDMFLDANSRLDTFDSDVDEPDPDLFYRIINAPVPNFREIGRNIREKISPSFGQSYAQVIHQKLRRRKLLVASVTGTLAVAGIGIYLHQTDPDFFSSVFKLNE